MSVPKHTKALSAAASLILCLLIQTAATAQTRNVTLEGIFSEGAGRHVELLGYSDPISLHEVVLDSTTIDSNNHFSLALFCNYPRLVILQIESYSQSFYVEPGRHYEMRIDNFDWTQDEQRNAWIDPWCCPYSSSTCLPTSSTCR